jgi:hypothetical protein
MALLAVVPELFEGSGKKSDVRIICASAPFVADHFD